MVAMVTFLVWFASGWICVGYGDGVSYQVRFMHGGVVVDWGPDNILDFHIGHVNYLRYERSLRIWWPDSWADFGWGIWGGYKNETYPSLGAIRLAAVPLWPIPAIAIGCWFIPRLRRKRRINGVHYCKTCEYDLTGNVGGICPECGAAAAIVAGTQV